MFDRLYARQHAIARHQNGPLRPWPTAKSKGKRTAGCGRMTRDSWNSCDRCSPIGYVAFRPVLEPAEREKTTATSHNQFANIIAQILCTGQPIAWQQDAQQ